MTGKRERGVIPRLTSQEREECLSFAVRELGRVETLPSIPLELQAIWRELATELRASLRTRSGSMHTTQLRESHDLTETETRVAVLYAVGVTPQHIAEQLGVSRATVLARLKDIFRKLGSRPR